MTVLRRLEGLGITLPKPAASGVAYLHVVQAGRLLFVSGQGPLVEGRLAYVGRLGSEYSLEQGKDAARLAAVNALAQMQEYLGSLDRVRRIVKVTGFVACTEDFNQQHLVVNGASELFQQVFGDLCRHARTSVGTNMLPMGIPVEVDLVAEVA